MAVINNLFLLAIPLHSQSSSHEIYYIDPSVGALKCSSVSKDKLFFAGNIQMQSSRESAVDDLKKHICTISGLLSLLHQWLFELFLCMYLFPEVTSAGCFNPQGRNSCQSFSVHSPVNERIFLACKSDHFAVS